MALIRRHVGGSCRVLAVVKAGGYGHGAAAAGRAALEAGAEGLVVSTVDEAVEVASICPPSRVLIAGGLLAEDAAAVAAGGFAAACSTEGLARALASVAGRDRPVPVHVKVDTGMGRLGCRPAEAGALIRLVRDLPGLQLEGVMTHFASADTDPEFTRSQFEAFLAAIGDLPGVVRHACNTAGALRHPEMALDAVRTGIGVYGCEWPGTRPALSLRSQVTQVKRVEPGDSVGYGRTWRAAATTTVAAAAIGYADGVFRARSGAGSVLVRGQRAPLLGRVSMDTISLDVSRIPGVAPGDVVTLIGTDGGATISAEEVAEWSGTISWEVLTSIGPRVERRYQE